MVNDGKKSRSFGTHDGTFHADEVTACALLILFSLIDEASIVRTRDPLKLGLCEFVCDVGGIYDPEKKLFDHHQAEYKGSLSSAGMILKYLKDEGLVSEKEYVFLNNSLIIGIDAHDNGKEAAPLGVCSFSHVISNFTPIHYDCTTEEQNQAFLEAVHFVHNFLQKLLQRLRYMQSCRNTVLKAMENKERCLIFNENIPWIESFFELGGVNHPALFVIMPSSQNHWKLRGIPPNYEERMKVRLHQPKEWAGLSNEELKKVSGIPGAVFCHRTICFRLGNKRRCTKSIRIYNT